MNSPKTVPLEEMIARQKWRVERMEEKARRATVHRSYYSNDLPVERAILANLEAQRDDYR